MNIGYIYKITNNINGKVYIGQTSKTIEERWRRHIYDSIRENRKNYSLQNAILKYGEDNFLVEEIEKCETSKLNNREIYWIAYYDSYHNGYNETLGGEGNRVIELNEDEVVEKYYELLYVKKVAKFFNCSEYSISEILKKHNIKILSSKETSKLRGNHINLYDLNNNFIKSFNSRTELGQWAIDNKFATNKNPDYAGATIKHYFYYADKIEYNGYFLKIENSLKLNSFEEKTIIQKKEKKPKIQKPKKEKQINICDICKKPLSCKLSHRCIDCENKIRKKQALEQRENNLGITREVLKQEIRNIPFIKLGKKYNVSDNAIRKWCKKYNLPYKSSEIKSYSDEEWEKL